MFDAIRQRRLESRRQQCLSDIHGELSAFDTMIRRAKISGVDPDESMTGIRGEIEDLKQKAEHAETDEELDELTHAAKSLSQLRAYACPPKEVADEGTLCIDAMEEWGVPGVYIKKLRELLNAKLRDGDDRAACGALRAVFEEFDDWSDYVDDYDETMHQYARGLFWAIAGLSVLAIVLLHFGPHVRLLVPLGVFLAGGAGGCASVISKLPGPSVRPSAEYIEQRRAIWSRIGTGVIASLIGCALLAWGVVPISVQGQTFGESLRTCMVSNGECTGVNILILLGIPMLFGFSERALASFEGRVFGDSSGGRPR